MKGLGNVKTFPEGYSAPSQTFNKEVLKRTCLTSSHTDELFVKKK